MKHVSGRRMAEIAADNGWLFISQNGSHAKYRNPTTGQTVIIPLHGNHDLRFGLQKALMKALGITEADL